MTAIINKIPNWGWATVTFILALTLAFHILTNPIVHGRMICANPDAKPCGKIRVVMSEGGHEFFSESTGARGFFVIPVLNRLKTSHSIHLFLVERLADGKEIEIPLKSPILIPFLNVISQSEIHLTVASYDIQKVEYAGGNIFSLVISLYDTAENAVSNAISVALASAGSLVVSDARAGDITDFKGFLQVQKSINDPAGTQEHPAPEILIGQSAEGAVDPELDAAIRRATASARNAEATSSLPLSMNGALRSDVERQTGFSIPDNHWREIDSPAGLATYLNARAVLAKKHPDLFSPRAGMEWAEAASKANRLYGERYIFLPESTVNSLGAQ